MKNILVIVLPIALLLAGCNELEEKTSDPKVLLSEAENPLPDSTLTVADENLQKSILARAPELKKYNKLTASIDKKDPDNGFRINYLTWSNDKTIITAQIAGGVIRYEKHYKCFDRGLFFCNSGSEVDYRMRIEGRDGNSYYIHEILEYPREYKKIYTEKDKKGNRVTKTEIATRDYADLPSKDYESTNYSMVFKNVPSNALRKFNVYERYCGVGKSSYDVCGIEIKYFDQEIEEQKNILKFLTTHKINSISTGAIEKLYAKYSKYDDVKEYLSTQILSRIKQKNSIVDLHEFNKKYKSHKDVVNESIDHLYKLIKIKDSVAGYEWFITNYSSSKYSKQALERIHEIMFSKAQKVDTIAAYNSFVFSYPTAKQVKLANELANEKERKMYTNLGFMGFWDTDYKKEKKARELLIKAKQIERFPTDNKLYGKRKSGYLIVANRMYQLLQEEFDDTDATLRHLESQEFKDFVKTFKSIMSDIRSTLNRIEENSRNISRYTEEMVDVSKNGFSDAKADRAMSAYYAQKHRNWEKFMHYRDKGYN